MTRCFRCSCEVAANAVEYDGLGRSLCRACRDKLDFQISTATAGPADGGVGNRRFWWNVGTALYYGGAVLGLFFGIIGLAFSRGEAIGFAGGVCCGAPLIAIGKLLRVLHADVVYVEGRPWS